MNNNNNSNKSKSRLKQKQKKVELFLLILYVIGFYTFCIRRSLHLSRGTCFFLSFSNFFLLGLLSYTCSIIFCKFNCFVCIRSFIQTLWFAWRRMVFPSSSQCLSSYLCFTTCLNVQLVVRLSFFYQNKNKTNFSSSILCRMCLMPNGEISEQTYPFFPLSLEYSP